MGFKAEAGRLVIGDDMFAERHRGEQMLRLFRPLVARIGSGEQRQVERGLERARIP